MNKSLLDEDIEKIILFSRQNHGRTFLPEMLLMITDLGIQTLNFSKLRDGFLYRGLSQQLTT